MAKDHPPPPEPKLAHEMWSREICDRLDEVIKLLKSQTATLVGDRSKSVQVELTEPDDKSGDDKPVAKTGSSTTAKTESKPSGSTAGPSTGTSASAVKKTTTTTGRSTAAKKD